MRTERFLYVTEVDLSIDNGPGINEREGIDALVSVGGEQITCMAPAPRFPGKHFNSKVTYVFAHRSNLFRYLVHMLATLVKILKLHRQRPYNAVVFRLGMTPCVPWLVSRWLNIPIVLKTLAGHSLFEIRQRPFSSRLMGLLTYRFSHKFIRSCYAADTVSQQYRQWLQHEYGIESSRLAYLPNGVNSELFKPKTPSRATIDSVGMPVDHLMGYVGAMEGLRHIRDLILCVREVQHLGRIGLLLVGEGTERLNLERMVRSMGLEDRIKFTGAVSYGAVPAYLNRFDLAFDLSLVPLPFPGTLRYTSFSQKIPQYLSCGLPVITWDTADTRFLEAERIGRCVSIGDRGGLVAAISHLLCMDSDEKAQIRKRARAYAVKRFSTEALAAQRIKFWSQASRLSPPGQVGAGISRRLIP